MASATLLLLLLCSPTFIHGYETHGWRRSNVPPEGYFSPANDGGSMLTKVHGTTPKGQGEPLNAIISGNSDSDVLKDAEIDGGLRNYFLSFGYSSECLGQHLGDAQAANLGDGRGYVNETAVIRWNYGDPQLGSCKETIEGGSHFRYWVQDGSKADSGAVFMAVSYEKPIKMFHDIIFNGYNLGRDWMVGNISHGSIPTATLTDGMTFSGNTTFGGYIYHTDVRYVAGLLTNGSIGVNHNDTVGNSFTNPVDGLVAVLSVAIVERPAETSGSTSLRIPVSSWTAFALAAFSYLIFSSTI